MKCIEEHEATVTVHTDRGDSPIEAEYLIFCAAHGITELSALARGEDLDGSYHLNFMLHVVLPPTTDVVLRECMASVNFVIQGNHGGMYACVVPPTENETGLAAMFAPGYDASYIDEYRANTHHTRAVSWDAVIRGGDFPGREAKIHRVIERLTHLNPFLRDVRLDEHRAVVGSVFNPHGETRNLRRLVGPHAASPRQRVLAMTSPKWTAVELAALTLLHDVLNRVSAEHTLPRVRDANAHGFGPARLDVFEVARELELTGIRFERETAERYLDELMLPHRIVPQTHPLYA